MRPIVLDTRQAGVCIVLKNLMKGTFSSFSQCLLEFVNPLPLNIFWASCALGFCYDATCHWLAVAGDLTTKTRAAVYPCRLILNMDAMAASDAPIWVTSNESSQWFCQDCDTQMSRREVLALYRRIFRVARQWRAAIPADTEAERQYIKDEARQLFRKNKNVSEELSKFPLYWYLSLIIRKHS